MKTTGNVQRRHGPSHDQIAALAYGLYVENGRQTGRELDDWLYAEHLLKQMLQSEPGPISPEMGTKAQPQG